MSKVAVLIPCYNEEITVEKVVTDFKKELPEAEIYVYDNNSTDNTAELATKAGAIVRKEVMQGKGHVVRSMFRDIDADVYVLVDGDDTYPADEVHKMIEAVEEGYDMVNGDRLTNGTYSRENKRELHGFGNNLVRGLINRLFHSKVADIMTGYRAFSRRFVKTMPVMSDGFQIETEMTVFVLENKLRWKEIPITYRDRPAGSASKLNTYKDGFKVLVTLFDLFKDYRPLVLFSGIALIGILIGLIIGVPVIIEFAETGFVSKGPSAILASGLFIISFLLIAVGLVLDSVKNKAEKDYQMQLNQFSWMQAQKSTSDEAVTTEAKKSTKKTTAKSTSKSKKAESGTEDKPKATKSKGKKKKADEAEAAPVTETTKNKTEVSEEVVAAFETEETKA